MKKIDTTKYLRQMKYLPDVTPLCGILIGILTVFMVVPVGVGYVPSIEVPEARCAQPLPLNGVIITFGKNGRLVFQRKEVEDRSKLPFIIMDYIKDYRLSDKKVFLEVDVDTPWGDVVDVMQIVKKAGLEVSGFTEGTACLLDFIKPIDEEVTSPKASLP